MRKLLDELERLYPEDVKRWDRFDYKVWSPISLDDTPAVCIVLKNKDKTEVSFNLAVRGEYKD